MSFIQKLLLFVKNPFSKLEGKKGQDSRVIEDIDNEDITNNIKDKDMSMFNYGVGGNEVKVDANEAIQEIQENKTLLVGKLTSEEAISPEIVTGLKTVEDVFAHFKPAVSVEHETYEGTTVKEEFNFKNVGDFTPKKLVENSPFLKKLKLEEEQYNNIVRQLKTNNVLRGALSDAASKDALVQALKAIALELETKK